VHLSKIAVGIGFGFSFLATAAGDVALLMVILLCGLGLRNRKRPAIVAAVIENYTRGAAQHQGIPTHSITSNLY